MDTEIIAVYCLCDDFLRSLDHRQDGQCRMTDAEVMTTAIVATRYFGGNLEWARGLLQAPRYMPTMLSRSRLNRRLHRVHALLLALFARLAEHWKALNTQSLYIIDSFPVAVCDPYRVARERIYRHPAYRGYQASKRRYFYGLKIHLMVTAHGQPVEFFLTPGNCADVTGLPWFDFHLPPGATIYADKAYNDYGVEDTLTEWGIRLLPIRRQNSKRPHPPEVARGLSRRRQMIETAGSVLMRFMPKSIHAVTAAGFELKVVLFVLGLSVHHILR